MSEARKEGLDSAVDFTKYLMTLESAMIAFIFSADHFAKIQTGFLYGVKWMTVLVLAISFFCGLVVLAGASRLYEKGQYSLDIGQINVPGIINVIAFAIGVLMLLILMLSNA